MKTIKEEKKDFVEFMERVRFVCNRNKEYCCCETIDMLKASFIRSYFNEDKKDKRCDNNCEYCQ